MITLQKDILITVLLGEVDSMGDFKFESYDPHISDESKKYLMMECLGNTNNMEDYYIFSLLLERDRIIIEYEIGTDSKAFYLTYNLKRHENEV